MTFRKKPNFIKLGLLCLTLSLALPSTRALAQSNSANDVTKLISCRALTNDSERLKCFDKAVEQFEQSNNAGDVIVVTKEELRNVERDNFGLNTSSVENLERALEQKSLKNRETSESDENTTTTAKLKDREVIARPATPRTDQKDKKEKSKDIKEVRLNILRVDEFGYKRKRFYLANGQVWEQITSKQIRVPKQRKNQPKNFLEIQKAAVGGFMTRVNGKGTAVRVKRVR